MVQTLIHCNRHSPWQLVICVHITSVRAHVGQKYQTSKLSSTACEVTAAEKRGTRTEQIQPALLSYNIQAVGMQYALQSESITNSSNGPPPKRQIPHAPHVFALAMACYCKTQFKAAACSSMARALEYCEIQIHLSLKLFCPPAVPQHL